MIDKKGQAVEIGVAVVIILMTLAGTILTVSSGSKIFVGDIQTKYVYDYSSCNIKINEIPDSRKIVFESLKKAADEGYTLVAVC